VTEAISEGYMVCVCDTGNPRPEHPSKWAETKIEPFGTKRVVYIWFDKNRWAWLGELPKDTDPLPGTVVVYAVGDFKFALMQREPLS
jgi:hypothetical protein